VDKLLSGSRAQEILSKVGEKAKTARIKTRFDKIKSYLDDLEQMKNGSDIATARKANDTIKDIDTLVDNIGSRLFWIKGERI